MSQGKESNRPNPSRNPRVRTVAYAISASEYEADPIVHIYVVEYEPGFREAMREHLILKRPGTTHAWLHDELGTSLDPIGGPYPTVGSRARARCN